MNSCISTDKKGGIKAPTACNINYRRRGRPERRQHRTEHPEPSSGKA